LKGKPWVALAAGIISLAGLLLCTWVFMDTGELKPQSRGSTKIVLTGLSGILFLGGWLALTLSNFVLATARTPTFSKALFWLAAGLLGAGILLGEAQRQ
jgi:hypothetical protein